METGYELIRRVAGGGMGEVFVARRTGAGNFEKRVALKLLLPHLVSSDELVKRFHDEARLAARMHHPNIVEIFDVGEAEGRPFIAMQFVDGVTLSQLIREVRRRGERLPLPIARHLGTGLCEALQYAHTLVDSKGRSLKVVHRDVTPGNLLLSRNGAVLLADFGIARVRDGSLTQPGVLRGKPAYIAPEQILGHARVDARADIYSAALTLYEALTGEHPFKSEQVKDALKAVVGGQIPPVESLRRDVSPRMAGALKRALAFEPADRFATAREFREAFVDGPSATAPEFAEFVARFAPPVQAEPEEGLGGGTKSVLAITPPRAEPPAPASARGRGLMVLLAVLGLGLAGAVFSWVVARGVDDPGSEPPSETATAVPTARPEEKREPEDAGLVSAAVVPEPAPPEPPRPEQAPLQRPLPSTPRPSKPPAAELPSLRVGYLTADATPWAEVSLGGKPLERTPFSKVPVPTGRHTLSFTGPNGETRQLAVTVREGEVTAVRMDF